MDTASQVELYSNGQRLNAGGTLLDDLLPTTSPTVLHERLKRDGYLLIRGFFDRDEVLSARTEIADQLMQDGLLDENCDPLDCIAKVGIRQAFRPDIAKDSPNLQRLLYGPHMMDFMSRFLEGEARHYDFTWLRTVPPGQGTAPHCDIVYMGRGTSNLYTAWVPIGDVSYRAGGLIVLESSNHDRERLNGYCEMDVDTQCENHDGKSQPNAHAFPGFGALTFDPNEIATRLNRRWLVSEYRAGDLLLFTMFTIHASLDNQSEQIRISSDSRYQLRSEACDERWIGENPPAHGGKMIRTMIC